MLTNRATVSKIVSKLYSYKNNAETVITDTNNSSKGFYAPHYSSGYWAYAYNQYMQYGNYVTENVSLSVYALLFVKI